MSQRTIWTIPTLLASLVALLVTQNGAAQGSLKDHVGAAKQSLQQSLAALRQYQWVETTAVSLKGEEKSRSQNNCYYGADGVLQKVPIAAEPAKKKKGLRGKIAENKKEELSASVKDAVALVKEYVPPDPARVQAAKDSGKLLVSSPDAHGNLRLIINDYMMVGDSLTIEMNAASDRISGVAVSTYEGSAKDAVLMTVSFGAFQDGTLFPQKIHLVVASQSLAVDIENSGYRKL